MRMTKTLILLVAVLSAPAYAVTDQERSALQRLNAELEAITKIIDEAQQAANPHDRKIGRLPAPESRSAKNPTRHS